MEYQLTVNGTEQTVDVEPETPLLWVLRDHLQLTGTKYGCGVAACGACTVQINGNPIRSCSMQIQHAANKSVTTIEGLDSREGHAIQAAWIEHNVVQCGYCQSGQIISAANLLKQNPSPSDADIDASMSGNICRCATYFRIKTAIKSAAKALTPA